MAKRKRLNPALLTGAYDPGTEPSGASQAAPTGRPPIAHVAGDAAQAASFAEVAGALEAARTEGRLIEALPLAAIETGHLVRDRIDFDETEMAALRESLRARGQQVPVEVVALPEPEGLPRYGLISGLRRILALRQIGAETVLALIRAPQSSAEAYLAMVEENEIRAGVSFYERARVSAEAARLGLFPSPQAAIAALFPQASPAKRSKIGSFVALHQALGAALRFPAAIPERLGLALVQGLAEDGFATRAAEALTAASPETAAVERQVLEGLLAPARAPKPAAKPTPEELRPGLSLQRRGGRLELSGAAVTPELERDLAAWLAAYMDGRPPEA